MMILRTTILGSPPTARIPRTERIHMISNTEATICNGRGKIPIAQLITIRIKTSHNVIG